MHHKTFGGASDALFRSVAIRTFRACAASGRPAPSRPEGGAPRDTEPAPASGTPCRVRLWDGSALDGILSARTGRGARLRLPRPAYIPDVFTLEIGAGPEQHPARVAWRGRDEIGIEFLEVV
ncbi:hypothetical protein [Methylobacterium oxalidis]|uniref:hypothetical protein n=1 Tax=Methylobacterium oxalidis TaxID=944322 RepID=UPI003314B48C